MNTAALDHLTAAQEHAWATPTIVSWLATIEATIRADRGEHSAAREAIDRSRTALNQPGRPAPAWFHDCRATGVTAANGHALLQAGEHNGAREALTAALSQSPQIPRRQRALILIDLAAVELSSGNLAAQRPLPSRALRALDEHLTQIAA